MTRPLTVTALAACDAVLGMVMILEPKARTGSPALIAALRVAPLPAWGAAILVLGVLVLTVNGVPRDLGLSVAAGWHAFFIATLIYSAATHATAGITGLPVFTAVMVLHVLAATGRVR